MSAGNSKQIIMFPKMCIIKDNKILHVSLSNIHPVKITFDLLVTVRSHLATLEPSDIENTSDT